MRMRMHQIVGLDIWKQNRAIWNCVLKTTQLKNEYCLYCRAMNELNQVLIFAVQVLLTYVWVICPFYAVFIDEHPSVKAWKADQKRVADDREKWDRIYNRQERLRRELEY